MSSADARGEPHARVTWGEGTAHEQLRALLVSAFEQHRDPSGHVTMRYVTEVWRAERLTP